jgi:hypothetical protein
MLTPRGYEGSIRTLRDYVTMVQPAQHCHDVDADSWR